MHSLIDRRSFLVSSSVALSLLADNRSRSEGQQAREGIRFSVTAKEAADDLATYEKAVGILKKKAANDPLNWARLASIHQNSCPHNNWFFLPWHRAYIHSFERICRAVTGNQKFMLPYWDWSVDRKIPPPFWIQKSPLFNNTREANSNSMTRADVVDRPKLLDPMLEQSDFLIFGSPAATRLRQRVRNGSLESVHNYIHGFVGGDMGDFMSPLDPIFWLHHAFVDRLWAEWQIKNGGKDPFQDVWLNTPMVFIDEKGKEVKTAASEMLSTRDLGYVYSGVPRPAEVLSPGPRAYAMTPPLNFQATALANDAPEWKEGLVQTGTFTARVKDVPKKLRTELDRVALEAERPPVSTRLIIEDMMVDPRVTFGVRVYLNCPNLERAAGPEDPHFVGNVFFFGLDHRPLRHEEKPERGKAGEVSTSAVLDLTRTLRELGKRGGYEKGASFDVQCLAVPLHHERIKPQGRVRFREFRLEVASKL